MASQDGSNIPAVYARNGCGLRPMGVWSIFFARYAHLLTNISPPTLTLSGREILLKISRVDGGWVWPVQSQELKVKFFVPQATNGGGRRVPWRRQCGRYPWASPNLYGSGFSIAVGVVLTTGFTAADRSPKASRNDLV